MDLIMLNFVIPIRYETSPYTMKNRWGKYLKDLH